MKRNASVKVQEGGIRLDAALLNAFPSTTRAFVREAVERGAVTVNGRRVPKGVKLKAGDLIAVSELLEADDNRVLAAGVCPEPVYEDASLLAFDKPAGMPVQPLSCRETGTLMNAIVSRYGECRNIVERDGAGKRVNQLMAGALHRIDADTSGLVIVARTQAAFDDLRSQFAAQSVKKTYLALVEGAVATGGTLENDLVHDPTLPFCRMLDLKDRKIVSRAREFQPRALHAVTAYRPLKHLTVGCEERTLMEVTIFTGVTHQIRAQLALAGMHIVNDRLYGAFAVEHQTGHALHALSAEFRHPSDGRQLTVTTALPAWAQ